MRFVTPLTIFIFAFFFLILATNLKSSMPQQTSPPRNSLAHARIELAMKNINEH